MKLSHKNILFFAFSLLFCMGSAVVAAPSETIKEIEKELATIVHEQFTGIQNSLELLSKGYSCDQEMIKIKKNWGLLKIYVLSTGLDKKVLDPILKDISDVLNKNASQATLTEANAKISLLLKALDQNKTVKISPSQKKITTKNLQELQEMLKKYGKIAYGFQQKYGFLDKLHASQSEKYGAYSNQCRYYKALSKTINNYYTIQEKINLIKKELEKNNSLENELNSKITKLENELSDELDPFNKKNTALTSKLNVLNDPSSINLNNLQSHINLTTEKINDNQETIKDITRKYTEYKEGTKSLYASYKNINNKKIDGLYPEIQQALTQYCTDILTFQELIKPFKDGDALSQKQFEEFMPNILGLIDAHVSNALIDIVLKDNFLQDKNELLKALGLKLANITAPKEHQFVIRELLFLYQVVSQGDSVKNGILPTLKALWSEEGTSSLIRAKITQKLSGKNIEQSELWNMLCLCITQNNDEHGYLCNKLSVMTKSEEDYKLSSKSILANKPVSAWYKPWTWSWTTQATVGISTALIGCLAYKYRVPLGKKLAPTYNKITQFTNTMKTNVANCNFYTTVTHKFAPLAGYYKNLFAKIKQ